MLLGISISAIQFTCYRSVAVTRNQRCHAALRCLVPAPTSRVGSLPPARRLAGSRQCLGPGRATADRAGSAEIRQPKSQPVTKVRTATSCCPFISGEIQSGDQADFPAASWKLIEFTVINPPPQKKKVLTEITSSSHQPRRTFVGNLYKQVKDPNLVGALSGHKEGSKAFARYRTIDDEMKKELVNLLS